MRDLKNLWRICVFLLGTFAIATAQENGTITGQVTDPTGAAVPGVTITVTHATTGEVRTTQSSASRACMSFPDSLSVHTTSKAAKKQDSKTTLRPAL